MRPQQPHEAARKAVQARWGEEKAPLPIAILADPGRRDHFTFWDRCAILRGVFMDGMIGGAVFDEMQSVANREVHSPKRLVPPRSSSVDANGSDR